MATKRKTVLKRKSKRMGALVTPKRALIGLGIAGVIAVLLGRAASE